MKSILAKLPIIRSIIAKRERAAMEAQAAEHLAAFWRYWDGLSEAQAMRVFMGE